MAGTRDTAEPPQTGPLADSMALAASGSPAQTEVLDRLSRIGQDITASFDFAEIFGAVERHLGALMRADTFYIALLAPDGEWLDVPLFVDGGRHAPPRRWRLDDPVRPASRCIREKREILLAKTPQEARANDLAGTTPTLSALFRPLVVQDRTIGAMSIQSTRADAYGERDRFVFRLLASSVAVALANAANFRRLADAEADRLRSLGQLVAGIAHEVNTPVGTALTLATSLAASVAEFGRTVEAGTLRRSDLAAFLERSAGAARLLTANLERASDLVDEFKRVAADPGADEARLVRLHDLVGSLLASLPADARPRADAMEIAIPADLVARTRPAALGRVIRNLLLDAVEGPGRLRLSAAQIGDRVRIALERTGGDATPGVPDPPRSHRLSLGLQIARSLAAEALRGQLTERARPGGGVDFALVLPALP